MRHSSALACLGVLLLSACQGLNPRPEAPFTAEEVRFRSGDIELAGDVLIPPAPQAGAVIIHGSGPSGRDNAWARAVAEGLAARGLAVVLPDKRGSGASGGQWQTAGFETLADDAVAAADLLRARGISRVGVVGLSQGGHIAPLAAIRGHLSFAASLSGSTVPLAEQARDEVLRAAGRMGLEPPAQQQLEAVHRRLEHYALTGRGWGAYERALAAAMEGPARPLAERFPRSRDHWLWGWIRAVGDYDPLPLWQRLTQPGLLVYGAQDTQIDVGKSVARWQQQMQEAPRPQQVLVLGASGHALEAQRTGGLEPEVLDAVRRLAIMSH